MTSSVKGCFWWWWGCSRNAPFCSFVFLLRSLGAPFWGVLSARCPPGGRSWVEVWVRGAPRVPDGQLGVVVVGVVSFEGVGVLLLLLL